MLLERPLILMSTRLLSSCWKGCSKRRTLSYWLDGETRPCGVKAEENRFDQISGLPMVTSACGKSLVDESLCNYHGIYSGNLRKLGYKETSGSADLVLCFVPHSSGSNTYAFTIIPAVQKNKQTCIRSASVQMGSDLRLATCRIPRCHDGECVGESN